MHTTTIYRLAHPSDPNHGPYWHPNHDLLPEVYCPPHRSWVGWAPHVRYSYPKHHVFGFLNVRTFLNWFGHPETLQDCSDKGWFLFVYEADSTTVLAPPSGEQCTYDPHTARLTDRLDPWSLWPEERRLVVQDAASRRFGAEDRPDRLPIFEPLPF